MPTRSIRTNTFLVAILTIGMGGIVIGGAFGDTIELTDGRTISGSFLRQGSTVTITADNGAVITAQPEEITGVKLTSPVNPQGSANAEWMRAALQIKNADDLQVIIAIHQNFLDKYPETSIARDVQASLGVYQKLAASDGVKFRGRWIPKAQTDVMLRQWSADARPAVDSYKAGRMNEALDAAQAAIKADDHNPDAWTVTGLTAYRMNNLPLAHDNFTGLASADPTSVLAENNLAVIAFQQKHQGEGIAHYLKALQIMPDNRLLLDNIIEAMNAYTGDKTSANYLSLTRQFEPAEAKMETTIAQNGLHRYGATWATQGDLDQFKKNEAAIHKQMSQLDAQYKTAQQTLAKIESQIKQASADYDSYQAILNNLPTPPNRSRSGTNNSNASRSQSSSVIANGSTGEKFSSDGVGSANPQLTTQHDVAVWNLDQAGKQLASLEAQRDPLLTSFKNYPVQAKQLQTSLASIQNPYTRTQQIMDPYPAETEKPPALAAAPTIVPTPPAPLANDPTWAADYEIFQPQYMPYPTYIPAAPTPTLVVDQSGGGGGRGPPLMAGSKDPDGMNRVHIGNLVYFLDPRKSTTYLQLNDGRTVFLYNGMLVGMPAGFNGTIQAYGGHTYVIQNGIWVNRPQNTSLNLLPLMTEGSAPSSLGVPLGRSTMPSN